MPTISRCPSDQLVEIQANAATTPTATVTFPVAVATDSSGSPVIITYASVPTGVNFAVDANAGTVTTSNVGVGTMNVIVTATDATLNQMTCTFNIVGRSGNNILTLYVC